jgi:predicted DCC family thiol-disulfide oxidoreductase YuxK
VAARPPAVTVLYDHDCGFCRWSVGRLLAWDRAGRLRPLAIQSPEGRLLLSDLTPEQRLATAHAVDAAGRRRSGGDALAPVAAVLPGGAPLAALARSAPALARAGYRAVAARRSLLGRLLSDAAKARADERIAQRNPSST